MFNINKYLANNEELVLIIRSVKFFLYLQFLLLVILFLVPFFLMIPILSLGVKGIILFFLIILLALYLAFIFYRRWQYNCILLTDRKLYRFYQEGLFKKRILEFYLDSIDNIDIEYQSLLARLFKIGDLIIYLVNGKYVDLNNVYNIQKIRNKIWERIN